MCHIWLLVVKLSYALPTIHTAKKFYNTGKILEKTQFNSQSGKLAIRERWIWHVLAQEPFKLSQKIFFMKKVDYSSVIWIPSKTYLAQHRIH